MYVGDGNTGGGGRGFKDRAKAAAAAGGGMVKDAVEIFKEGLVPVAQGARIAINGVNRSVVAATEEASSMSHGVVKALQNPGAAQTYP